MMAEKVDLYDPGKLAIGAMILVVGIGGNIGYGGFLPIPLLQEYLPLRLACDRNRRCLWYPGEPHLCLHQTTQGSCSGRLRVIDLFVQKVIPCSPTFWGATFHIRYNHPADFQKKRRMIFITGAAGKTGHALLQCLAKQEVPATALVRSQHQAHQTI